MTAGNDIPGDPPDAVLFSARLVPHRSLTPAGFLAVMAFFGAVSFVAGVVFLWMGAWPVFGFFGLDVLIVWYAFRVNFARAGAHEDVSVSVSELKLRRVSHRGDVSEWRFNPLWVRIDRREHPEFGLERLFLVSRGRHVSVGHFLPPEDKERFAGALQAALHAARRGPLHDRP